MEKKFQLQITSTALHILAMVLMLCDHLWGTVVPGNDWLTCIGRLAFPIFAFMLVEGYFHTRNLKKYVLRLLIFALLSELPFNLAIGSRWFYPVHQNVLWTFLLCIGLIHANEIAKAQNKLWLQILTGLATTIFGALLGLITMLDYYHAGVLTVLVFYFFRQRKWWSFLGQLICLWYINTEMLGGLGYELQLWGHNFFLPQQSFALLALLPIWLYRGKQGFHNKFLQYTYYAFYPVHLLILGILKMFLG